MYLPNSSLSKIVCSKWNKLDKIPPAQYKSMQLVRGVTWSPYDQSERKAQTTFLPSADHTDQFGRSTQFLILFNKEEKCSSNRKVNWQVLWGRSQQWKSVKFNQSAAAIYNLKWNWIYTCLFLQIFFCNTVATKMFLVAGSSNESFSDLELRELLSFLCPILDTIPIRHYLSKVVRKRRCYTITAISNLL